MASAASRLADNRRTVLAARRLGPAGHALAAAGLALAVASYGAAFLPVEIGMWPRIEPVILVVHAASAMAALGLVLLVAAGRARALAALGHPYVLVLAGAAAVALATAPFARFPVGSLIGAPETAEGALLFAELAVLLAAGLALRSHRPTWRALVWGGAAVSWIAAAVTALPGPGAFVFGDWLAFYAIGVAVAVACSGGSLGVRGVRIGGAPLGLAAALPSLVVSLNLTAIALFAFAGVPLWFLVARARRGRWVGPGAIRQTGAALAALVPVAVIAAVAIVGPTGLVESIRSRARVDQLVFAQIADVPATLVHGQGWGQAGESFVRYLTAASATMYDRSWDLVFRDYMHTHDYALEALLAGGAVMLAVALLAVAMAPLWCRRAALPLAVPFAVVLSGVAAFWFQLPMTMPSLILALAAIARPAPVRKGARPLALVALPAAALASLAAVAFLLQFGLAVRAALAGPVVLRAPGHCLTFPAEGWRGDVALRYALVRSYEALEHAAGAPDATEVARTAALACEVDRRSRTSRSAMLATAGLLLRADVAFDPKLRARDPAFARLLDDWPARLRHLLAIAPMRSDLAIPYFGWRLRAGDMQAVARMAGDILARRPRDPVGLWFSGVAMISSADRARQRDALLRLRAALDGGIERFMPVEPAQKARILALTAGQG